MKKVCVECKKEFESKTALNKYCSSKCKDRVRNRDPKKKEQKHIYRIEKKLLKKYEGYLRFKKVEDRIKRISPDTNFAQLSSLHNAKDTFKNTGSLEKTMEKKDQPPRQPVCFMPCETCGYYSEELKGCTKEK